VGFPLVQTNAPDWNELLCSDSELGVVTSLSKPDANLTGVSGVASSVVTKQLGLIGEFAPKSAPFALLINPASPNQRSVLPINPVGVRSLLAHPTLLRSPVRSHDGGYARPRSLSKPG
jgi:hypothetical protein